MSTRIQDSGTIMKDATAGIGTLMKAVHSAGLPGELLELVHMRASQINGCAACLDSGARNAKKSGMSDERIFSLAAWRETPYYSEAERAVLALTEAATRLADRADPVPDEIWAPVAKHFNGPQCSALVLWIATSNFFNRLNVTTRTMAPQHW